MNNDSVLAPFYALLPQLPVFLLYLVGIAIALWRWKWHPRVSLLLIVSLSVSLVWAIINTFAQVWLPSYIYRNINGAEYLYYAFYVLNIVSNLVHFAALGLLLFAVFSGRRANQLPPPTLK